MKKIYMSPEMDVIELKHQQTLLAGSNPVLGEDFEGGDEILAPGMEVGPNIPGMPSFLFE